MMRLLWVWFNRVSTVLGLAFMLAEGCTWTWSSIRAGHVVNFRRIHQQFEEAVFDLIDPAGSRDGAAPVPALVQETKNPKE